MKKNILTLLLVMTMGFMITGCSSTEQMGLNEEGKVENNEITAYVGNTIFESSLDPIKGAMSDGYSFINNALIKVNEKSEYVGDIANSWTISEDALTYTFTLRPDIQFTDGSDFTAEDVVFTYETVMKNQGNNENVDLTKLDTVTAIDDYTVAFKLKACYSPFFDTVAKLQIVPSDAYNSSTFDTHPIGTGAWKIVQYDTNQQMILEANENYYDGVPKIKKVTLVYMDQEAAFAAAQSGQLDIVMVSPTYVKEVIPGMCLQTFDTMDVRNISLPVRKQAVVTNANGDTMTIGNNVTSDPAVRKALSIGINRQDIINHAFNGVGKPAIHFTNNLLWASNDDYEDAQVEVAKQLLENAGWMDQDGDGIREKDGVRCTFDVYAPGSDKDRYNLAVALGEDASKLGIEIVVKTTTWDEVQTLKNTAGIVWGWGQYSPTVIYSLLYSNLFLSGDYDNVVGYENLDVDAAISQALSANTQEKAIEKWQEAQSIANEAYPYLYLVNIQHCYFVSNKLDLSLTTQIPHPHGHGSPIICNMNDWSFK